MSSRVFSRFEPSVKYLPCVHVDPLALHNGYPCTASGLYFLSGHDLHMLSAYGYTDASRYWPRLHFVFLAAHSVTLLAPCFHFPVAHVTQVLSTCTKKQKPKKKQRVANVNTDGRHAQMTHMVDCAMREQHWVNPGKSTSLPPQLHLRATQTWQDSQRQNTYLRTGHREMLTAAAG